MRFHTETELYIPPLISGGVMLSYRCTNRCRHCLYRCSPKQPNEWMSLETAEKVFDALTEESRLHGIHLAGGEPMIKPDLLLEIIRLARTKKIWLDYIETNAFWCSDYDKTLEQFAKLKHAGLPAVLVSVSMFHNEFVPFHRTKTCVQAAREIFGTGYVFVYMPHMYKMLSAMPDDVTHSLEEFCDFAGLDHNSKEIPELYSLIPGGRATESLRDCYTLYNASIFKDKACRAELMSTSHFHIDNHGNLFTGLCAGIVAADVTNLHPDISPETHPIFCKLADDGPYGLMLTAKEKYGYSERLDGYASKCDLCFDVRKHLNATGEFKELRPSAFYEN